MMRKPKISGEEWRALEGQLETEGWLIDSYDPKNRKECWRTSRWGEAHYVRACKILGVERIFKGVKYKKLLKKDNFSDILIDEKYFYKLGLFTEVFHDEDFHSKVTVTLTRRGYEWFYAYTTLRGKSRKHFGGNPLRRCAGALFSIIFACFYVLALRLAGYDKEP